MRARRERVATHIKRLRAALERVEGGRDILRLSDFELGDNVEAELVGRDLNLIHIQHGSGIADIGHDRQSAEIRKNLAQELESLASRVSLLER